MTINRVVYIPSRGRPQNIEKIVPKWHAQRYQVRVVVEAKDHENYKKVHYDYGWTRDQFRLVLLPESDAGIGYARQFILEHARDNRRSENRRATLPSFIMADDDVMPKAAGDLWAHQMVRLQQAVENTNYIGCAAVHSYQDLILDGFLKKDLAYDHLSENGISIKGRPCIAPNGSFGQCYAINTLRAIHIGGFDPELTVAYEDNDFMMRSISHKAPWLFHSGVWMDRIGGRFEPGGIADYCDVGKDTAKNVTKDINYLAAHYDEYSQKLLSCRKKMKSKWEFYTNDPEKKAFRISWKKLYDGQIPSWKSMSAVHGGKLTV